MYHSGRGPAQNQTRARREKKCRRGIVSLFPRVSSDVAVRRREKFGGSCDNIQKMPIRALACADLEFAEDDMNNKAAALLILLIGTALATTRWVGVVMVR